MKPMAILIISCLCCVIAQADEVQWWTTHGLEKLFPDSVKPEAAPTAIVLKAARNETEDAQVAIRTPKKVTITRAEFETSDLTDRDSHSISKDNVAAYWVWYTYVLNNPPANKERPETYLRKAPAFFPDGFLEGPTVRIRDEWTQPLWISVHVPPDAVPGEYFGHITLRLTDDKGATSTHEIPVSLTVWHFALPTEPTLHHTEWFSYGSLAQYYRVPVWSEAHWEWIAKVAADMGRHRQDTILTPFQALVDVSENADGTLRLDFTRLDRWVEMFKNAGVTWIEGGHIAGRCAGWESAFVWARFAMLGADGKPKDVSASALTEEQFEPLMRDFLQGVRLHLKEKGWDARYIQHIADEPIPPNRESWVYRAHKVREWLPGTPIVDAVMSGELDEAIDISVPQIQHIEPANKRPKGETFWSYVCLYPQGEFPNRFLDYPSIRNRILFWLSYSLELKGFLHWGYSHWMTWDQVPAAVDISPWTDATGASIYVADRQPLPAGDPFIVYPGRNQICGSIRWEVVRKGMEDFEYLHLLDQVASRKLKAGRALTKEARALVERVRTEIAVAPATHTRDDQRLLATREEIGALLDKVFSR